MADIKTISLRSDHENPQILLRRDWTGDVVMRTEAPFCLIRITRPGRVTIPMFGLMGRLTREREAQNLRNAMQRAVDIFVVHCETKAGVRKNGMIAVPKARAPIIEIR